MTEATAVTAAQPAAMAEAGPAAAVEMPAAALATSEATADAAAHPEAGHSAAVERPAAAEAAEAPPPFQPGDHLWKSGGRFGGRFYDHHLIYAGPMKEGGHRIIENSFKAGRVVEKVITADRLRHFVLYARPEAPAACLGQAESALGERYNLLWNNCETFANRCARSGVGSRQVRRATGHLALATAFSCGLATALTTGCVATHSYTVIVVVPATGHFSQLWHWAFGPQTVTQVNVYKSANPAGVAAASGATCAAGIWSCFALRSDHRKRR